MSIISEFKAFALKGNMIDMATGIIIGAAIGKVVSSLVSDIIMPPIGVLLGGVDFTDLSYTIQKAVDSAPEVVIKYGQFIQTMIDFLVVAMAIFLLIKLMNRLRNTNEEEKEEKPTSEDLLVEIRDLLKQK